MSKFLRFIQSPAGIITSGATLILIAALVIFGGGKSSAKMIPEERVRESLASITAQSPYAKVDQTRSPAELSAMVAAQQGLRIVEDIYARGKPVQAHAESFPSYTGRAVTVPEPAMARQAARQVVIGNLQQQGLITAINRCASDNGFLCASVSDKFVRQSEANKASALFITYMWAVIQFKMEFQYIYLQGPDGKTVARYNPIAGLTNT